MINLAVRAQFIANTLRKGVKEASLYTASITKNDWFFVYSKSPDVDLQIFSATPKTSTAKLELLELVQALLVPQDIEFEIEPDRICVEKEVRMKWMWHQPERGV